MSEAGRGPWDHLSDAEIIHTYSDADALRDGELVPWGKYTDDRTTRAVWERFTWPVQDANGESGRNVASLLYVWVFASCVIPDQNGRRVYTHRWTGEELWLIPNEVGGQTLMFPCDH